MMNFALQTNLNASTSLSGSKNKVVPALHEESKDDYEINAKENQLLPATRITNTSTTIKFATEELKKQFVHNSTRRLKAQISAQLQALRLITIIEHEDLLYNNKFKDLERIMISKALESKLFNNHVDYILTDPVIYTSERHCIKVLHDRYNKFSDNS